MKFTKYHALGNDYLVLDAREEALPSLEAIRTICHRHFGLGSDGILYGPLASEQADFGLRIFNPDSSEAEKSGNGLRIFARYLKDTGAVMSGNAFTIETLGGVVSATVYSDKRITVDMGSVSFNTRDIPVCLDVEEAVNLSLELEGETWAFCAATIGNPHVVLPLDHISEDLACRLGPQIETLTDLFPNRTNVQFMKVLDRGQIQIEIWERGAGYTLASGSSSSAAGAVAKRLGFVDDDILVRMPGGTIELHINDAYEVRMTGPASRVGLMTWTAD